MLHKQLKVPLLMRFKSFMFISISPVVFAATPLADGHSVNPLRPRDAYICINKINIIGSDNGLAPGRRQAIIWNNAGILLVGPLGTNFTEILIEAHTFSFKKMHLEMSSWKWRPFCLGLNVLKLTYWSA